MKVTVSDCINVNEALKLIKGKELPTKLSYWLSRLEKKIEGSLKAYEEQRIELCKKYGKINDAGNAYEITDKDNFQKEFIELQNIEEEITFNAMKLDTFEGNFSKEFFILMDKFIDE